MICMYEIDGQECHPASYVLGIVVDVPNGVAIRDGACVERPEVTTRSPAVLSWGRGVVVMTRDQPSAKPCRPSA